MQSTSYFHISVTLNRVDGSSYACMARAYVAQVKGTVDEAISIVQKKLVAMAAQLRETDSLEVAIEIARRVRTAKKVLFTGECVCHT